MKHIFFILALLTNMISYCVNAQPSSRKLAAVNWIHTTTDNRISRSPIPGEFLPANAGPVSYFLQTDKISVPYIVYVPKSYDPQKPSKLVVYLHNKPLVADSFQYRNPKVANEPIFTIADTFNTIVLFPFARRDFFWGSEKASVKEAVVRMILQTEDIYNIDKHKIYIGGQGDGGFATYWFVTHYAKMFAGFYTFGIYPNASSTGSINFRNITKSKPLYSLNIKDDETIEFSMVLAEYNKHKKEAKGWHFETIETGGHRIIFGAGGAQYVRSLLGELIVATNPAHE